MTNWTNVTSPEAILHVANANSNNMFFFLMNMLAWFVLLIVLSPFGIEMALLASSFVALVISILLVYMGLVAWYSVLIYVGIIIAVFFYIIYSKN